jgi:hypothetical protein
MADDNEVEIRFGASTDDVLAGIAQIRSALSGLTEPVRSLSGTVDQFGDTFGAALPVDKIAQCVRGLGDVGAAAQRAAAQAKLIDAEIKVLAQDAAAKKVLLNAEVSQYQITQDQKFALLQAETQKEYEARLALLQQEVALDNLSERSRSAVLGRIAALEATHRTDMLRLDEDSIAAQQTLWNGYLSTLTSAFNTQIRGLLEGTTSWQTAMKKVFEDLTIKFIEMVEQMIVKWLAAELAQTTATTTGAAARAAAEQTSSSAGVAANAANALQAITTDAGQAFAGVFAFLAPTMGPAAAGPAAAAQASVSAAAIFDVGTDYVVRGGLALIHPGETIIPAARGTGPYTGASRSAHINAPVSINVSALDSQSVARFFNDNSRHILRSINDAVKRGAHLGLNARHL